tara:strand:- start:2100 stop:2888 length:789 start_codon:yes stop_codon:yes gene_type:complete
MNQAPRPWRAIPSPSADSPYLLGLHCEDESVHLRVTDMLDFWSCSLDRYALEQELKKNSIEGLTVAGFLANKLQPCFDEQLPSTSYSFTIDTPKSTRATSTRAPLAVLWRTDSIGIDFLCTPETDPAVRLRDELIVPLLRQLGHLECALPEDAKRQPSTTAFPFPTFQSAADRMLWQMASAAPSSASKSGAEHIPTASMEKPAAGSGAEAQVAAAVEAPGPTSAQAEGYAQHVDDAARKRRKEEAWEKRRKAALKSQHGGPG